MDINSTLGLERRYLAKLNFSLLPTPSQYLKKAVNVVKPLSSIVKISPMPSADSLHSRRALRIAFTYDSQSEWLALGYSVEQCAEFDTDQTIDAIAMSLRRLGTVEMVGGQKSLTKILATCKPNWDIVFNICEGFGSIGREAQVPALLEGWGIPFTFSDLSTLALCLDKAKTKMVLEHYGVPVAPFACIPSRNLWGENFNPLSVIQNSVHREALNIFPLFLKPAAEGTGMGITQANKVANQKQLLEVLEDLSQRYPTQTILIERFLAGREFTVGIIGTGADAAVLGVREFVFLKNNPEFLVDPTTIYASHDPALLEIEVYGYDLKHVSCPNPQYVDIDLSIDPVAQEAANVALKAWNLLGCRDGGRVDLRQDKNDVNCVPSVIEVNPLPGLTPDWSDFPLIAKARGIEYDQLIGLIIKSALKRYKSPSDVASKMGSFGRLE